ncbi:hypothetical protein LIER_20359 [Lithospermum erythrorhizon]|uniref:Uncharacterized protein n=1 Tax=Lithospermum erythrorhizon TaxID=34254 RepID=A0AAV3QPN7_LITER
MLKSTHNGKVIRAELGLGSLDDDVDGWNAIVGAHDQCGFVVEGVKYCSAWDYPEDLSDEFVRGYELAISYDLEPCSNNKNAEIAILIMALQQNVDLHTMSM